MLGGRLQHGVAPDQTDQRQVAVQARPPAPLVVAQPQLLFAIFMKALDRPAAVGQLQLLRQRPAIQPPGEEPFRVPGRAGQGALPNQPTLRARDVAVGPMHPQAGGRACTATWRWSV